jgi:hypothetical protein
MVMRDKTRKALDAVLSKDWWIGLAAVLCALSMGLGFAFLTTPLSERSRRDVVATVTYAKVTSMANNGRYYVTLDAKLDDGRLVRADGAPQMPPPVGARITIEERTHWLWVPTYRWRGAISAQP